MRVSGLPVKLSWVRPPVNKVVLVPQAGFDLGPDTGRWEEAEQLQVHVMEARKIKLGEDHPDKLTSIANLAATWKSSGKTADAINLLRDCLAKKKQAIGPNHPRAVPNSKTLLKWETE
ncbi:tetratricopeptide repeat protein [Aspergillus tanneri]|uniref:Kinesin light chain n=1 Tax=Aspergillus tanneri TaxID=1220188 RepID=A0A5M9MLG1_9EURO|nr:uncharacterized protein ATNIH1004_006534 [Aspergillus tanneri]KAA8647832.1 hypothetical protein ATNIH1004_006534 [Aspergillus tanneri]